MGAICRKRSCALQGDGGGAPEQVVADGAVRHHHALGLASGTGCVDDIRQVLGGQRARWVFGTFPRQGHLIGIQADAGRIERRQGSRQGGNRDQRRQAGVVLHERQALKRVSRVERHVDAARLEHPQHPHRQFQRTLQADAHTHFGPHPQALQMPRQAVGLPVEFGIRPRLAFEADSHSLGRARRLGFEEIGQRCFREHRRRLRVGPCFDKLPALHGGQQRQGRNGLVGRGENALDQGLPVRGHARDGGFVEQVGIVFEQNGQPPIYFPGRHGQVELRRPARDGDALERQAGDIHPRPVHAEIERHHVLFARQARLLVDKHGLEERRAAEIALRVEALNQHGKGIVLVLQSVQFGAAHLLENFHKRGVAFEAGAHDQ